MCACVICGLSSSSLLNLFEWEAIEILNSIVVAFRFVGDWCDVFFYFSSCNSSLTRHGWIHGLRIYISFLKKEEIKSWENFPRVKSCENMITILLIFWPFFSTENKKSVASWTAELLFFFFCADERVFNDLRKFNKKSSLICTFELFLVLFLQEFLSELKNEQMTKAKNLGRWITFSGLG